MRQWVCVLLGCGIVIPLLAFPLFARELLGWLARRIAAGQIEAGAVSTAQQWLDWSARLVPNDDRTDLLRAVCFRHQHQEGEWRRVLQMAQGNGAPLSRIEQEVTLGLIRAGEFQQNVQTLMSALAADGVPLSDIYTSFVHGYLARGESAQANLVLDVWEKDQPGSPHISYMRAVYWFWLSDHANGIASRHECLRQAEAEFLDALAREPRHEASRMILAEMLENQCQFARALEQYGELVAQFPTNDTAKVCLARVLRKLERLDEAREVLGPLVSRANPAPDIAAEMGQTELEVGNVTKAQDWFHRAGVEQTEDFTVLNAAASALAFAGKAPRAALIFSRIDAQSLRSTRIGDLQDRLAIGSGDKQAEDELRGLLAAAAAAVKPAGLAEMGTTQERLSPVRELYELHCTACHGTNGDGNGRAARHLFPKPRDLRTGKTRLVSTRNGIPTTEDIEAVMKNGMPGTSMQVFDQLTDDQRRQLAQEVLRLNQEGIRSQMLELLKAEGEEVDEQEVRQVVLDCTTPGEVVPIPQMGPVESNAVARGKDVYFGLGCQHCHGDDGVGVADNPVYDERGEIARARDLVHEPFKGGQEVASIYLRIVAGMPGSPHPAASGVGEGELVDLVWYCAGLAREPKSALTNLERANRSTGGEYLSALAGAPAQ